MEIHKKKIVIIGIKGFPPSGGSARSLENLIFYLKNDYELTFLMIDSYTEKSELIKHSNINFIIFKKFTNGAINTFIYYLKSLFYVLNSKKFDLVFLNHAVSGFITPFLKIRYKVFLVVHGVFNKQDEKFNYLINLFFKISERFNYIFSDYIISVSKPDINHIKKFTKNKIYYIPNGVILPQFQNKQFDPFDYNILFASGRIYNIKGLHILLESLAKLNYSKKVKIIGDLSQVPDYKKMILKISSKLNVDFEDIIKDRDLLFEKICNSKIFVFPSLFEGMSNMLLEVASLKTPLICSDIPSNRAVFSDEEVLFFKSNDHVDLALQITWAENNYDLMIKKANKAYIKITTLHNWKAISKQYSKIFELI